MKDFKSWLARKHPRFKESWDSGSSPVDRFKFNDGDSDVAGDYEKDLVELAKVVMTKYRNEFNRFLKQVADENNDGEIRSLLRRLETDRTPDPWKPSHPKEPDEIVAPKADRGAETTGSN